MVQSSSSSFIKATSLIPQAIQEGPLNSFKSYNDITIFHYNIPKQVLRATWQFTAFMNDKNCISRDVYIHLKYGSYPIISPDNSTFPMNNNKIYKTSTKYQNTTTLVIQIDSPDYGDWFIGSYMLYFDDKIQQQGFGNKCHYSIGSIGMWIQENEIQTLQIGIENIKITTIQPSTYYKIFIPSGTWTFRLKISSCKSKFKLFNNTQNICIKSIALQGRTLPIYNYSDDDDNFLNKLMENDTIIINESSPFEDSYYYLLIVSDSIINFNISIITTECQIKIKQSTTFIKQWVSRLNINDNNSLQIYSTIDDKNDNKCAKRLQLIRVKKLSTFSSVYLFQGKDYLTPWLMMTKKQLVIVQFDILPLVDIGGSLDISIENLLNNETTTTTTTTTFIIICVRRGRVPKHINESLILNNNCDMMMNINISLNNNNNNTLLIPYPQPDTWYIGLQVKCYSKTNEKQMVECDSDKLLVSLNVKTQQCVFSDDPINSCGKNGVCQETHRDGTFIHYTSCNCFGGYKGWACTDDKYVKQYNYTLLSSMTLIISNIFFIPSILLSIKRKLYTESLVYISTMIFSSIYHACDESTIKYCITKYQVLQYSDFFSSILAFWVTLVSMAKISIQLTSLLNMFGVFIIGFLVEYNRTDLYSILIPLGIAILIPILSYIYKYYYEKKTKLLFQKQMSFIKLIIGLSLVIIGLILFTFVETQDNYQYIHSLWHIIISLSLIFLLP
ncbi:transmembrane protein 8B-like, partial [Aphidius gifuensis]|uniref:transmembrane protein 8B-like n=1 Tax=Aphidius gifuensis TaxID=684658 RepID=UPI001CDBD5DA